MVKPWIAILGARPGDGASTATANLAAAVAMQQQHCGVLCGDVGGPIKGLSSHDRGASRALSRVSVGRVDRDGARARGWSQVVDVLTQAEPEDARLVLIDAGAGAAAVPMATVADYRVVVVRPERTSVDAAYAVVKTVVWRTLQGVAAEHGQVDTLKAAVQAVGGIRVGPLLDRLGDDGPELASAITDALEGFQLGLLGWGIGGPREANVLFACGRVIERMLRVRAPVLGNLPHTAELGRARALPYVLRFPSRRETRTLMQIGSGLLSLSGMTAERNRSSWGERLSRGASLNPLSAVEVGGSRARPEPAGTSSSFAEEPVTGVISVPPVSSVDDADFGLDFVDVDQAPAPVTADADLGIVFEEVEPALLGADELPQDLGGYARRHERFPLHADVQVSVNGDAFQPGRCVDVSEGGVALVGPREVYENDHLEVVFGALEGEPRLRATVQRVDGQGRIGAQLVRNSIPVSRKLVEHARQQIDSCAA